MTDHSRQCKSAVGFEAIVIIALVEMLVGFDGINLFKNMNALECANFQSAGDRNYNAYAIRITCCKI